MYSFIEVINLKKSKISKVISIILLIILVVGIGSLFFLPYLYDVFKGVNVEVFSKHTLLYQIAFYSCYLICLIILYKLIKLFNIVYKGNPFRTEVSNILKINMILFMALFLIVIIKAIFIPTILSFAVALVCFIASLSFYVLSEVITSAIKYKNEVDLTV